MEVEGNKNMFSYKKMKADEKKRKRRMNRKKVLQPIQKRRQDDREHISSLDHQLVKTSSIANQSHKMELDFLRLELKLLKDAYENHRKLHENCNIVFQNKNLKVQKGKNKSTASILYQNTVLKRDNDEVELSDPRVKKEEYVEYVEKDTVKPEPIDQDNVKNEPLIAERMKIESKPCIHGIRKSISGSNCMML